jgi:phospholipid/cholesterol/gamma-HCH transport system ATP-binding protein
MREDADERQFKEELTAELEQELERAEADEPDDYDWAADFAAEPIIEVRDLEFAVPGEVLLHDVSFEVYPGEVFGLMGMSGCGKSTLLRCLMGLNRATRGVIEIDGQNIVGKREDELNRIRHKMGMCFQEAALFDSMTVADNVGFGLKRHTKLKRDQIRQLVDKHLEIVGLEGTGHLMPAELSGGMRKRVGIARALIMQPAILFYDEPTSGLDPVRAAHVNDVIHQLRGAFGTTSIVVTHDVHGLFDIADRVLMIDEQTVAAYGTPDELRASSIPIVRQFVHGEIECSAHVT